MEENKTQIDKLLEVMTDYGITSYIGLNFAEIRKEIIEVRKELSKKEKVIDLMAEMYMKLARELSIRKEVTDIANMCFGCKYEDEECNGSDCIERFKEYISKKVEEENANNKN